MKTFSVYGLAVLTLIELSAGQSKYCCSIPQWESMQSQILGTAAGGTGSLTKSNSYVYYDATNRRIAAFVNSTTPTSESDVFVLQVFTSSGGKIYILDLKNRQCTVQATSEDFKGACVPDAATKTGDIFFGTSLNPLKAVAYHLLQPVANDTVEVFLTVTADEQCVPVTELVTGTVSGVPLMQVIGFVDIRPGISRPSVFNVPPECQGDSKVFSKVHRRRRSAQLAGLFSPLSSLFHS